jgi:hypothetical protein
MPSTDLIIHKIPIYQDVIPKVAKFILFILEEIAWLIANLLAIIEAGIIRQYTSP